MIDKYDENEFDEMDIVTWKDRLLRLLLMAAALAFCGIAWWWIIKTAIVIIKNIGRLL